MKITDYIHPMKPLVGRCVLFSKGRMEFNHVAQLDDVRVNWMCLRFLGVYFPIRVEFALLRLFEDFL